MNSADTPSPAPATGASNVTPSLPAPPSVQQAYQQLAIENKKLRKDNQRLEIERDEARSVAEDLLHDYNLLYSAYKKCTEQMAKMKKLSTQFRNQMQLEHLNVEREIAALEKESEDRPKSEAYTRIFMNPMRKDYGSGQKEDEARKEDEKEQKKEDDQELPIREK